MSSRKRLLKHLRSLDRERAIGGVKNAAWDITHLSDFVRRIDAGDRERKRYIFATADKGLARIAPLLLKDPHDNDIEIGLATALEAWWPHRDARRIVTALTEYIDHADKSERQINGPVSSDFIDALIERGESNLRAFEP
ncbi:conserved hypothetical protein [Mesorhizobium sp. STM 4661]|nr:conserved hypothetical protein [Mesorhizobium sp. STM 4661]